MTEEIVDGIAWTPESRARIYASRRIPNHAYRLSLLEGASVSYPFDAEACRDRALYYWSEKRKLERVEAGLANNPPGWRGAVETALARGKQPKQDIPLDIDVEAATVTLELCRTDEVGRLFARLARRDSKRGGKTFAAYASKDRGLLGGPKPKPKPKAKAKDKR